MAGRGDPFAPTKEFKAQSVANPGHFRTAAIANAKRNKALIAEVEVRLRQWRKDRCPPLLTSAQH